ncbi:LysR substrate-binding domain-containing protein [Gimibacter soli]|uniref:LysR substrate-binding domain-containing protein n=1 Tax=Gimibacter soli TaxID=3024400 RepID=A0AAF0BLN7_9PROT|nr:LysR substrate-binding domain-containing protein [Gimibacter soli]WCL53341.1 LysR substrate-binding domain-containing protein [Gimibacter soli]
MAKIHENFLISRLKLKQLKLLTVVAQEGNILKASQVLNIAQPAATKNIRELEETLGIRLFERSSRGVAPTSYGDVMIKHAKLILAQLRHASEELTSLEEGNSGRIFVGTLLSASSALLPRAVALMKAERPGIAITIVEGINDKLMPSLRTGDLDIVLGRLPSYRERDGLTQEILYTHPISIVVRKGHPLADRPSLTLKDLANSEWIMPSQQTTLRRQIVTAFLNEGLEPPADLVESVSIMANHALLTNTDMVAAMPFEVANAYPGLARLPINLASADGEVGATTRAGADLSPAAAHFMAVLRRVAEEIKAELLSEVGAA